MIPKETMNLEEKISAEFEAWLDVRYRSVDKPNIIGKESLALIAFTAAALPREEKIAELAGHIKELNEWYEEEFDKREALEKKLEIAKQALRDQADYGHEYSFKAELALEQISKGGDCEK